MEIDYFPALVCRPFSSVWWRGVGGWVWGHTVGVLRYHASVTPRPLVVLAGCALPLFCGWGGLVGVGVVGLGCFVKWIVDAMHLCTAPWFVGGGGVVLLFC